MHNKTPILPIDKLKIDKLLFDQLPFEHIERTIMDWYHQEKISLLHFCQVMRDRTRRGETEHNTLELVKQEAVHHVKQIRLELSKIKLEPLNSILHDRLDSLHLQIENYFE
jgi:hypothetical protein